jgi:uncharacterized membrane protein
MKERPRLKIDLTTTDKILEILGWTSIPLVWVITTINYSQLPDIIPTHFNGFGNADGFGSKISILMLPLIATVLFLLLSFLNRFPHVFNYPFNITTENAYKSYRNATRLIRLIKLIVVIVFGIIVLKVVHFTQ